MYQLYTLCRSVRTMMDERFTGATWRISEIPEENCLEGQWKEYFKKNAEYLLKMVKENEWVL